MGKSLPSTARLQDFARIIASHKPNRPKHGPKHRVVPVPEPVPKHRARIESERLRVGMEESSRRTVEERGRVPLATVVSDCVKRWFEDTLTQAKGGDAAMQVLVGQMYCSGYGIPRDAKKGRAWISKASRIRSSVWRVSDKRPGYNASDSDSDDMEGVAK
ncbi:Peptide chain release factor 1 like [Actinidia chinensis var. chinensis]|uniref:Peptide chain release factor 1 like n=1 Tax=Actinidia chinensis var. chinensis TaxID=1590841 RepID=A0A2R6RR60_ACTCC|nr:Peptide chain release factor 1 like [Actinidia chinensis var. chinensis]